LTAVEFTAKNFGAFLFGGSRRSETSVFDVEPANSIWELFFQRDEVIPRRVGPVTFMHGLSDIVVNLLERVGRIKPWPLGSANLELFQHGLKSESRVIIGGFYLFVEPECVDEASTVRLLSEARSQQRPRSLG
ncbi:MAG: hypothetical protein ACRDT9_15915, partial [Agromyces sp.]